MSLRNQNWITFGGESVTGRTPTQVRVSADTPGLVMNAQQEGFVAHAYKLFCDAIRVSAFPDGYHVQNRRAPDGTEVRMESNLGVHRVFVKIPPSGGGQVVYPLGFVFEGEQDHQLFVTEYLVLPQKYAAVVNKKEHGTDGDRANKLFELMSLGPYRFGGREGEIYRNKGTERRVIRWKGEVGKKPRWRGEFDGEKPMTSLVFSEQKGHFVGSRVSNADEPKALVLNGWELMWVASNTDDVVQLYFTKLTQPTGLPVHLPLDIAGVFPSTIRVSSVEANRLSVHPTEDRVMLWFEPENPLPLSNPGYIPPDGSMFDTRDQGAAFQGFPPWETESISLRDYQEFCNGYRFVSARRPICVLELALSMGEDGVPTATVFGSELYYDRVPYINTANEDLPGDMIGPIQQAYEERLAELDGSPPDVVLINPTFGTMVIGTVPASAIYMSGSPIPIRHEFGLRGFTGVHDSFTASMHQPGGPVSEPSEFLSSFSRPNYYSPNFIPTWVGGIQRPAEFTDPEKAFLFVLPERYMGRTYSTSATVAPRHYYFDHDTYAAELVEKKGIYQAVSRTVAIGYDFRGEKVKLKVERVSGTDQPRVGSMLVDVHSRRIVREEWIDSVETTTILESGRTGVVQGDCNGQLSITINGAAVYTVSGQVELSRTKYAATSLAGVTVQPPDSTCSGSGTVQIARILDYDLRQRMVLVQKEEISGNIFEPSAMIPINASTIDFPPGAIMHAPMVNGMAITDVQRVVHPPVLISPTGVEPLRPGDAMPVALSVEDVTNLAYIRATPDLLAAFLPDVYLQTEHETGSVGRAGYAGRAVNGVVRPTHSDFTLAENDASLFGQILLRTPTQSLVRHEDSTGAVGFIKVDGTTMPVPPELPISKIKKIGVV